MSLQTLTYLRQRTNFLIGDTSATTSAILDSHINASIGDICNAYPFSWDVKKTTGAIAGSSPEYSLSLAADFNPKWRLQDARIVGTTAGSDHVFSEIVIPDRGSYGQGTYRYWVTYDTSLNAYVLNTKEPSGTITYYYWFQPAVLSAGTDICVVPDAEAVCLLAASKNWTTDERNQALSADYEQKASTRIQSMWQSDNAFGPVPREGTVIDDDIWLALR